MTGSADWPAVRTHGGHVFVMLIGDVLSACIVALCRIRTVSISLFCLHGVLCGS